MKIRTFIAETIIVVLLLAIATAAQAQSLDINPGLWKKAMKVEVGGRTLMDSTIDACMTASDLSLKKSLEKLVQSPSCKILEQELATKRLRVVMQCKGMRIESMTEVRSRDSVVVIATMRPTAGQITTSREEWKFVSPDCTRKSAN